MELLYGYGFVLENNCDDQIAIEVKYDDTMKLDFCSDKKIEGGCKYNVLPYKISEQLLHYCRVLHSMDQLISPEIGNSLTFFYKSIRNRPEGRENQKSFYKAALYYRYLIRDYM